MHVLEMECDECGMSFPEDCLTGVGSSTLCKWCCDKHVRERAEDEKKLTYEGIARFIHRVREMFPDEDDDEEKDC